MEPPLEVLIPVRNPGAVLRSTIDSLLAQTDRRFSVLLSDNFSTSGAEQIAEAESRLREAGLAVRILRPPWELGRVQHWNWLHHQSEADWLKPLFVGDWLEAECFAACREAMALHAEARFLFYWFRQHRGRETTDSTCQGLSGMIDPATVPRRGIFEGNFVGGPINVLYHRAAFQAAGGHLPSLPYLADADLYLRLAQQVPTVAIPRVLGHFVLHEERFSKRGSGGARRESMVAELAIEALLLRYAAFTAGYAVPGRPLIRQLLQLACALGTEAVRRRAGEWKRRWRS